ncbi:MAG: acyl-CoA desaturase, partial [Candidatus Nanopelagicales bacterium]
NGWVSVLDLVMLVVIYTVGVHGITIGYHRLFTHDAYKAGPKMRAFLALAGSLAVEGRVVDWVADHRKHHQFSDADGDPHSPWEYGPGTRGLIRGFTHAHVGWLFTYSGTDTRKYAPDLIADKAIDRISKLWPVIAVISMVVPTAIGYAVDGWAGALQAFFWVTLVRVALVHHMTWSINSVCHVWGKRPFVTRDRSANVAWLAPISGGESWHNYHHADPTSARHGVLPWQMDTSAVVIRLMERMGLVKDVKWPSAERIERKLAKTATPSVSADS